MQQNVIIMRKKIIKKKIKEMMVWYCYQPYVRLQTYIYEIDEIVDSHVLFGLKSES
jgi:hypothetical protein